MGRVSKGEKCSVLGCPKEAVRSVSRDTVNAAGLKVEELRRAYLCKDHYKEFKKKTKREKMVERWRHRS
jgi:hypothetical protein